MIDVHFDVFFLGELLLYVLVVNYVIITHHLFLLVNLLLHDPELVFPGFCEIQSPELPQETPWPRRSFVLNPSNW